MSKLSMEVQKPLGIILNNSGAQLLLKGLKTLPEEDKKNVVYDKLVRDLETVVTIWDRRTKNSKILEKLRATSKLSPQSSEPPSKQPPQASSRPPSK